MWSNKLSGYGCKSDDGGGMSVQGTYTKPKTYY